MPVAPTLPISSLSTSTVTAASSAFDGELRLERGVGAHAVVLAVADNHAAVEAQVAGAACRHYLDFGGKEVLFLDAVLFGQQFECKAFTAP